MKYLHTMIRVSNLDESLDFFINTLGLSNNAAMKAKKAASHWCSWLLRKALMLPSS